MARMREGDLKTERLRDFGNWHLIGIYRKTEKGEWKTEKWKEKALIATSTSTSTLILALA